MAGKALIEAVAYFRASSATNAGADKASEKRQLKEINDFARKARFAIVDEF